MQFYHLNEENARGRPSVSAILSHERRRRAEAAQAEAYGELSGLLLPLCLSLARLSARIAVSEAAQ